MTTFREKPVPMWRAVLSGGCVVEQYDFVTLTRKTKKKKKKKK